MVLEKSSLLFTVRRKPTELVAPANPTPHELKMLSDIDDQGGLRCHMPVVQFFRFHPSMAGKDPVQIIRQALAQTLVFYYPFAGRLKEGPSGKLMADCSGEGVLFIEADADVTLEQFGNDLQPPFPCFDELLYNVPGSDGIINSPPVLAQVTRLKCGSFIFAMCINHTMSDGVGITQFTQALAEIARGAPKPSILPVWRRELLCTRDPPRVTCIHHEYQQLPLDKKSAFKPYHASFFIGPKEITAMRRLLPHHLAHSPLSRSSLYAYGAVVQLHYSGKTLIKRLNPPLPEGFYGNAFVYPAAVSTVGKLCGSPLGYALELVKMAKDEATKEYVHSVADLMAIKGRPCFTRTGSFMVSELIKAESREIDYGWGESVYTGLANAGLGDNPRVSFYLPHTNPKGEQGRVVLISLPEEAMERFEKELNDILKIKDENPKC